MTRSPLVRRRHYDIVRTEVGDAGAADQRQYAIDLVAKNLKGAQRARLACARRSMKRRAAQHHSVDRPIGSAVIRVCMCAGKFM